MFTPCFVFQVPKQRSDPRNRITLELVGFDGPKDFPRLYGNANMHLYEVIRVSITKRDSLICGLYRLCFETEDLKYV